MRRTVIVIDDPPPKVDRTGMNGTDATTPNTANNPRPLSADDKKPRHFRLTNNVSKSPITIKIEDDSDEEVSPPEQLKRNGVYNGVGGVSCTEKAVQTDNVFLVETIRQIIKERMRQYENTMIKEKGFDKQLSPLLDKLERENEELRRQAKVLRSQIVQKENEKQSLKRRCSTIENALQSKTSPSTPTSSSTLDNQSKQHTNNFLNRSPNLSNNYTRPAAIASNEPLPRMTPTRPLRPPPPLHPAGVQSAFQAVQQRPVHMIQVPPPGGPPSQQMIRHPFAPNERFVFVNNQMIPSSAINGINTQIVASNQGLRMTSMPPDITSIRPPMDTHTRAYASRPPNLHDQHILQQRIPVNNIQPQQLRQRAPPPSSRPHVPNTARPYNQPHPARPPQPGQNVPNLAIPFSPLPKLTANISTSNNAIVLTWNYEKSGDNIEQYKVECYQLFAHQAKDAHVKPPLDTKQWKKIGVVNALPLPMACTLTQFASGSVYFFAVVAVDIHGREGEMSNPCVIRLDVNQ